MNTHAPPQENNGPAGHLVILGNGPQAEWEYAVQGLAAHGPLLLIDNERPTWQRPHLSGARRANALNPHQVLAEVRKFAIQQDIAGIINFHPAHTRAAAHVRRELRLPGPTAASVEASTLRHRTAEILKTAHVDHADTIHADTYEQALHAAHKVGFPLICKPASPRKRHAARRVNKLHELAEAFSSATAATWPGTGTILQPQLDGIEATAYTTTSATKTRVIAISHTTFDPQAEPTMLPLDIVVDADDVCAPAIEDIAQRALSALGMHSGPAQIRLQITATGPRVLSITTHLTDPLICMLIEDVTGTNLIATAGRHACGQTTSTQETRTGAAAVRFIQGPHMTRLQPTQTASPPHPTLYATLEQYPAAHRVGPLNRQGHILVSGRDYPQCAARLTGAAAQLRTTRVASGS